MTLLTYIILLLKDNFLKSILHTIKMIPAAIVKKKELGLLSVNNKNQKTTVKTVSNSQYGKRVESFSFLYAYCSNTSDNIQKIADKNNKPNISHPIC